MLAGTMRGGVSLAEGQTLEERLQQLRAWPSRLLRTALISSGALHLGGVLAYVLVSTPLRTKVILVGVLVGLGHIALIALVRRRRLCGWLFLLSLLAEIGLLGAQVAWPPTLVLLIMIGTVYGGLVLGRFGGLVTPAGAMLLALAGGLALRGGWTFDVSRQSLNDANAWLRVAAMFLCLTAVTAASLRHILKQLLRLEGQTNSTLQELLRTAEQASAARSSRLATETVVHDAQKLQTIAQLSGGIAHLVNNALTVVSAAAEQLAQTRTASQIHAAAREVAHSVERATVATRALLVFGRREQWQAGPVSLSEEVSHLASTIAETLPENIHLRLALDRTPQALAEVARLRQLILNLVLNARDATVRGGTITLATSAVSVHAANGPSTVTPLAPGEYVRLTVSDDGVGMPSTTAANACDPFFTTKDPTSHDGLGLFVVFGLLKQWGGSLAIESAEGRGTSVSAYLPVAPNSPSMGAELAPAATVQAGPGEAWRLASVRRALRTTTVAFGCALLGALLLTRDDHQAGAKVLCSVGFLLLGFVATRTQRLPHRLELGVLLGSLLVASSWTILHNGFISPVAIAAHATAVLLAAVYAGNAATWATLLGASSIFVLGARGPLWGAWFGAADPTQWQNWLRVGLVLPVVCVITSRMVLDVLARATRSLGQIERSLDGLLLARQQRQAETESLTVLEQVVSRAGRLETAGRAAGTIAHDLNNALTGMQAWADMLLLEAQPSDKDVREAITVLRDSVEFADALITQLEPHGLPPPGEVQATNVAELVEQSLLMLRRTVGGKVQVEAALAPGCVVPLRANDLRRIVFNLAANARDAMPEGGTLSLKCRLDAQSGEVVLEVSDTGSGVAEATRVSMFDAFFTTKPPGRGTGLGLHTVAQLMQLSGGKIAVQSELAQGTRFTLRWPATAPLLQRPRSTPSQRIARRALILMAEDNDAVRRVMAHGLERAGHRVVLATDGHDARIQLALRDDWDALCTDAIMPGYPSADLIADFQARFPGRPVVLCSGHLPETLGPAFASLKLRFLAKPFSPARLVDVLDEELTR